MWEMWENTGKMVNEGERYQKLKKQNINKIYFIIKFKKTKKKINI